MAHYVSARLDDELNTQLEVFAQANQLNRSQALRELLRQVLTDADPISRGWQEGYAAAYAESQRAIHAAVAGVGS